MEFPFWHEMRTLLIAGFCAIAFSASAATIVATPTNLIAYGTLDFRTTTPGTWQNGVAAGSIAAQRVGGTSPMVLAPDPVNFVTFCMEPEEDISAGVTYTWEVETLDKGATSVGGIGEAKADLIRELIGREYSTWGSTLTNLRAAAIQVAIWEIVQENSATLSVTGGNMRFRRPSITQILDVAQSMLNALDGTGPKAMYLYALTNPTNQDLLVMTIPSPNAGEETPEPATYALFGLGLLTMGIWRRTRRANS